MWLFISLMCNLSILGYGGWSFFNNAFPFILLHQQKKSFL
jgi:hypothetical protein